MSHPSIAALDAALAATGEWITLRRIVGQGSSTSNIDVKCRARIDAISTQEIAAGISQTELNVILSPTQINDRQWPGGQRPLTKPFDGDQRVPRIGSDRVIARGRLRVLTFVDPKYVDDELVRINMRVSG